MDTREGRSELKRKVCDRSSQFSKNFHAERIRWNKDPNRGKRGPGASGSGARRTQHVQTEGVERQKCVGVWWPASVYKQYFQEAMPRRRRKLDDRGRPGCVLKSDGFLMNGVPFVPDECERIYETRKSEATLSTDLVDEEGREGHAADAFQHLAGSLKLKRKASGSFVNLQPEAPIATDDAAKASTGAVLYGDLNLSLGLTCGISDSEPEEQDESASASVQVKKK